MGEINNAEASGGRNMKLFGIITIILGILAIGSPLIVGLSIALLVGLFVIAAGIVRIIWAFRTASLGKGLLTFAIGGLTLLCGVVLATHPVFTSGILSILLAVYLVVDGVFEIVAAIRVRPSPGWGWLLVCGIISFLLGLMIWQQFPLSGAWAIGILLGVKLLIVGMTMIRLGSIVRSNV